MNAHTLARICSEVYRRFPQVAGSQPKIQPRSGEQVMLIFRGASLAADGHKMNHTIRVVADPDGKIIKITNSK
jgi:hypothetical protein